MQRYHSIADHQIRRRRLFSGSHMDACHGPPYLPILRTYSIESGELESERIPHQLECLLERFRQHDRSTKL
jgi:hypothetical protein